MDDVKAGEGADVVVVGAGASGLATAAALRRLGTRALLLERGAAPGSSWVARYRSLRLNSGRPFSTLPGHRYPRGTPLFPTRDDVVRHLDDYCREQGLTVRTGTTVQRLDPDDSGGWLLSTSSGPVTARQVLVATGALSEPAIPAALASGEGPPVVHSCRYVDAAPYRGRNVLVVGAGSSGMEIAHDLVAGGARRVLLSVRTPPNVLPRSVAGLPGDPAVHLMMHLPPRVADAQLRLLRRAVLGDLSAYHLPVPEEGPFARLRRDGGAPAVVDREVIDDIRGGRVTVVPAVTALRPGGVLLASDEQLPVDVVLAATGFRPGLEPLVGHLGVLDGAGQPVAHDDRAALPGLRFVNYQMRPGLLFAARGRARRAARAVARDLRSEPPATTAPARLAGRRP